jgi:hypothetical protein
MRNRKTYRRFWSRETEAMLQPLSPAPDTEPQKEEKDSGGEEAVGRAACAAITYLSYLSLPIILFVLVPDSFKPLCMLAAVFSGHKVLTFDPDTAGLSASALELPIWLVRRWKPLGSFWRGRS